MNKNQTLASPQTIIWHYLNGLRRTCARCVNESNLEFQKEDAAQCLMLSVTVVDAFLNVYFQVLVNTDKYTFAKSEIDSGLKRKIPIDRKIKEWPKLLFDKSINLGKGAGQKFMDIKGKRNSLVHFSSSYETLELPDNVFIHGLADISFYESLTSDDALAALNATENFLREVFKVSGHSEESVHHCMHLWAGIVPPIEIFGANKKIQRTQKTLR